VDRQQVALFMLPGMC